MVFAPVVRVVRFAFAGCAPSNVLTINVMARLPKLQTFPSTHGDGSNAAAAEPVDDGRPKIKQPLRTHFYGKLVTE